MHALTNSQIATIRNINGRPGTSVHAIGMDYATTLEAAGYITIRKGKCYPTAAASAYPCDRTPAQRRNDMAHARATLIGRWGAMI